MIVISKSYSSVMYCDSLIILLHYHCHFKCCCYPASVCFSSAQAVEHIADDNIVGKPHQEVMRFPKELEGCGDISTLH